jgi:hypothetical protein
MIHWFKLYLRSAQPPDQGENKHFTSFELGKQKRVRSEREGSPVTMEFNRE